MKKKESNFLRQTFKPMHMHIHSHTHTLFWGGGSLIITFVASTLFYLSGKKICLGDQEFPVSPLSLKRTLEHFAPGNLRACLKVLKMLTLYCPESQVIRKCGGMRCIGSMSTGAGPPDF